MGSPFPFSLTVHPGSSGDTLPLLSVSINLCYHAFQNVIPLTEEVNECQLGMNCNVFIKEYFTDLNFLYEQKTWVFHDFPLTLTEIHGKNTPIQKERELP